MKAAARPGAVPVPARRIEKPWGYELVWAATERYAGKILHIESGHQLSFQYHRHKDETVFVLSGAIEIDVAAEGGRHETLRLGPGESYRVYPGVHHRFRALVTTDLLEASSPELDDVVRLRDDYGRATP